MSPGPSPPPAPPASAVPPPPSGFSPASRSPLVPVLVVTLLASFGTGLFWHGLGFIAESVHGFTPERNLMLAASMGAAYVAGAFSAHDLTRALARRLSPRGVLVGTLVIQGLACVPVAISDGEWTLWVAALVATVASSVTWPLVEAFLSSGRHGAEMRRAIAAFNFTWMPAVAMPMFVVGPFMEELGAGSIAILGPLLLVAAGFALRLPAHMGGHDAGLAAEATGPSYGALLQSARILLPLSYVLTSAMSPLLPYRFKELGVSVENATPAAATWMGARILVLLVMWRLPAWHGRWDVLLLGGLATAVGFTGIMLLPGLVPVLASFAVFGGGLGIIYYAALYYGMAVGHAGVDAGGTHEGLIGLGYCIGPMIAIVGVSGDDVGSAVGLLLVASAIAAVPAVRPWLADRRRIASATTDSSGRTGDGR